MTKVTLKSALLNYAQRASLSDADRAHLQRWNAEARDPIWEKVADEMEAFGELPPFVDYPYAYLIGSALRARREAERLDKPNLMRERNRQQERQRRTEMLQFADTMKNVVDRYKEFEIPRPPNPTGKPSIKVIERDRSLRWLERESLDLRQRAHIERKDGPTNISRQSGGKGKRARSREVRHFVKLMVDCMN